MSGTISVEVVFALTGRQRLLSVDVPEGTTVAGAICRSGIADAFPDLDLLTYDVAVWGTPVDTAHRLEDGDRIEILRPLAIDPREARRQLAQAGGIMGSGKNRR